MSEEKLLALMHGELDGVNSPRERARLKSYLAASPEAQKLYDELAAMSALLQKVKPVEPPPHLQNAIMNTLPRRRLAKARAARPAQVRNWFAARFEFKYALVFACGAVAGVALLALFSYASLQTDLLDPSKLSGTIGAGPEELQRLHLKQAEVDGTIILKSAGATVVAEITLASPQALDLLVSFDESDLEFKSFALHESAGVAITSDSGVINLMHAGRKSYTLFFEKRDAHAPVISFQVLYGGQRLNFR
jgi:hypothetical protein